jgi:hypothetical protein
MQMLVKFDKGNDGRDSDVKSSERRYRYYL